MKIPEGRQCGCGHWNTVRMRKADFLGGIEIPSYVCSNCGEVYFDQSQAELIDVIRTARRDKEAAEARLRDAEAQAAELKTALKTLLVNHFHNVKSGGGVAFARKIADKTTTGAFDRLRNEVLEEAANIGYNEVLQSVECVSAALRVRGAIRAVKK